MPVLGCLPFLNVKPLSYLLENEALPDGWSLRYAPPSELAKLLQAGEICAAPVSSFECLQNPNLKIIPDICIASRGAVKSVLLFSKVPMEKLSSLALDSGSLSGAAMLKIILAESYGATPEFVACEPDIDLMLDKCDAGLLLGNAAMQANARIGSDIHVMDLGEEWLRLTGLPAVFAVWAVTACAPLAELIPILQKSKAAGMRAVREIAEAESNKIGLSFDVCYDYLANVMIYDMRPAELEGLKMFACKAYEHGLLNAPAELLFAESDSAVGERS
ncbi:MAG: menaquinone biosynthesis protein [Armatimonadota bacterium]|nr:menaquinone biosynthesis protein [Armatimonadota bacterium]